MTTPAFAPSDFTNVIPPQFSTQIIQETLQQSAVLSLGTRLPMGTRVNEMPIPKTFPKAAWANAPYGSRKPYTTIGLDVTSITAEEIAAVIAIPDAMVEDSSINLWTYCRPLLAQAIAVSLDNAVLFGEGAPASFPPGGISGVAAVATAGRDVIDTVNNAMSLVEVQGLNVTGSAADVGVRGLLRGVRADDGSLLLGPPQAGSDANASIYGVPGSFVQMSLDGSFNFVTGAWQYCLIGVRQDIRYQMDASGVLVDDEGKVVINAFQDNVTLLKVWARFGCAILKPVTLRQPDGALPFAVAALDSGIPSMPEPPGGNGGEGLSARRAPAAGTSAKPKQGAST